MAKFDAAVGRYVHLSIKGIEYRVYFEEAGQGIPMLLQHTAGADGRQWRHLLEDADVQRNFRMIAYDLPYHGKSVPPESEAWWSCEYRLTKAFLIEFVVTLARELGLDRPVYMGSSIGGHLATDLALEVPEAFRAIIGLEAAIATPTSGDTLQMFYHPRIGNEYKAQLMYEITAPQSPEAYRRETAWVYSQGAPRVFLGDLFYYCTDHDLRQTAEQIDTSKVPLYVLNGEYDFGSTPAMGEELARRVKGLNYRTMPKIGHFPMSENPALFKEYIAPILAEIAAG